LNEAIIQAKQIDEQSKQAGFYQEALDFTKGRVWEWKDGRRYGRLGGN
jgi:hypothetical protein